MADEPVAKRGTSWKGEETKTVAACGSGLRNRVTREREGVRSVSLGAKSENRGVTQLAGQWPPEESGRSAWAVCGGKAMAALGLGAKVRFAGKKHGNLVSHATMRRSSSAA